MLKSIAENPFVHIAHSFNERRPEIVTLPYTWAHKIMAHPKWAPKKTQPSPKIYRSSPPIVNDRSLVIKHVAFFTNWAKLTMAFTCTSLLLNLYTSVFGCGCGFGFEHKFWRIDGFGEKKGTDWRICIPLFTPPPQLWYSRGL